MCGIFGAVSLNGYFERKDYDQFVKLTDLVSYRGPDAADYLALNLREKAVDCPPRFDVFLGHRGWRLSISPAQRINRWKGRREPG